MQEDGCHPGHVADKSRRLSSCLSGPSRSLACACAHGWASERCLQIIRRATLCRLCATLHRMVRDPKHPDNSHPPDQKFLAQIETHGWSVTDVFRREGETGPEWAFSTGLFHSYQHPEIVIFGLELDNMQKIVNNIGSEIKNGAKYESGNEYHDIFARCACQFRPVDSAHYRDYLGAAIWFYNGEPFPVLQCFWPDHKGHYPWDPECSPGLVSLQPLL